MHILPWKLIQTEFKKQNKNYRKYNEKSITIITMECTIMIYDEPPEKDYCVWLHPTFFARYTLFYFIDYWRELIEAFAMLS